MTLKVSLGNNMVEWGDLLGASHLNGITTLDQ